MDLRVIVDSRERNQALLDRLCENGICIDNKTIPIGDYILSDRVCIERKTLSDFQSSIRDGRIFEQIKALKYNYTTPLMIVEEDKNEFRMNKQSVLGALCSIAVREGVNVLFSADPIETADIISIIAKQEQITQLRMPSLKGNKRAKTKNEYMEYVIGNVPGVGPKLSVLLLKHFKNIKNIANASLDELILVEGIGRKKAQNINKILNELYE